MECNWTAPYYFKRFYIREVNFSARHKCITIGTKQWKNLKNIKIHRKIKRLNFFCSFKILGTKKFMKNISNHSCQISAFWYYVTWLCTTIISGTVWPISLKFKSHTIEQNTIQIYIIYMFTSIPLDISKCCENWKLRLVFSLKFLKMFWSSPENSMNYWIHCFRNYQ